MKKNILLLVCSNYKKIYLEISYLKLFHREPIVWEGINKDKSLIKDREKDPSLKEFFSDELFDNIDRDD